MIPFKASRTIISLCECYNDSFQGFYNRSNLGVSENRGPLCSTLKSTIPTIIRTPEEGTLNFRKLQTLNPKPFIDPFKEPL